MATKNLRYSRIRHYTFTELMEQFGYAKRLYEGVDSNVRMGKVELTFCLQPTENSIKYTIKLRAKAGSTSVDVFVDNPKIHKLWKDKPVPHLYPNGSLCLYYPPNGEWSYKDSWAETLIPWTSLWLFYYEVWQETGKWLGGGIHGNKCRKND